MTTTQTIAQTAGRFGPYGGRYVPETLVAPLEELERATSVSGTYRPPYGPKRPAVCAIVCVVVIAQRPALSTSLTNSRTFDAFFFPGFDSTPLATSTANGSTSRMARAT